MKRCPLCNRTYSNDEFAFCLADGALLSPPYDPAETQILPAPYNKKQREQTERLPFPRFWESLLALGKGRTTLNAKLSPSERPYIGTSVGISGLYFFYVVSQHGSRVELYIDRGDVTTNKRVFDELLSDKHEIEAAFGEPLSWQRLETKRACRIAYKMTIGGYKDDEAHWQTIQTAMIDAMVRLEKALSPFIPKLAHLK